MIHVHVHGIHIIYVLLPADKQNYIGCTYMKVYTCSPLAKSVARQEQNDTQTQNTPSTIQTSKHPCVHVHVHFENHCLGICAVLVCLFRCLYGLKRHVHVHHLVLRLASLVVLTLITPALSFRLSSNSRIYQVEMLALLWYE